MKSGDQEEPDKGTSENVPDTPPPIVEEDHAEIVYRRIEVNERPAAARPPENRSFWTQTLAPTIMPLLVGFMLLLGLILVLGLLSVRRMDEVSVAVLNLEQQHAARLSLLLKLRLDLTKLNNEARARSESESRRELRPPFASRLGN